MNAGSILQVESVAPTRTSEGAPTMALRLTRFAALTLIVLLATGQARAETKTIARCGAGFLEDVDGYPVLHLKGTPYEMGYQQGALLREHIRENMDNLLVKRADQMVELGFLKVKPRVAIDSIANFQKKFVPPKYYDELRGLAAGADIKYADA